MKSRIKKLLAAALALCLIAAMVPGAALAAESGAFSVPDSAKPDTEKDYVDTLQAAINAVAYYGSDNKVITLEASSYDLSGTENMGNDITLVVPKGKTLNVTGSFTVASTLKVEGTVSVAKGATLTVNGDLTNSGDVTVSGTCTIGGTFTNSGDITVNAGATCTIGGTFANSGEIEAVEGTTINSGGTFTVTGNMTGSGSISVGKNANATLKAGYEVTGTLTNDGTVTVSGGSLAAGGSGKITNNGKLAIGGLTLNDHSTLTNSGEINCGVSIDDTANMTISDGGKVGGDITVNGSLTVDGDYTQKHSITVAEIASMSIEGCKFTTSSGTTTINGSLSMSNVEFNGPLTVGNDATVDISNNSYVTVGSYPYSGTTTVDDSTFVVGTAEIVGDHGISGSVELTTEKGKKTMTVSNATVNEAYTISSANVEKLVVDGTLTMNAGLTIESSGELVVDGTLTVGSNQPLAVKNTAGISGSGRINVSGWLYNGNSSDAGDVEIQIQGSGLVYSKSAALLDNVSNGTPTTTKAPNGENYELALSRGVGGTFAVKAVAGAHGSVSPTSTEGTAGSDVRITATPDEGYMVDSANTYYVNASNEKSYAVNVNGNVCTFSMPNNDVTLYVNFKKAENTSTTTEGNITVVTNHNGNGTVNASINGRVVTVTVRANTNYVINTVSIAGRGQTVATDAKSGTYSYTVPGTSDATVEVYVTFKSDDFEVTLTNYTYDDGRISLSTGTTTTGRYAEGEQVTIYAFPDRDFYVRSLTITRTDNRQTVSYSESSTSDDVFYFTMPASNVTVRAYFTDGVYEIATDIDGSGRLTITGEDGNVTDVAEEGEEIRITASPSNNYRLGDLYVTYTDSDDEDQVIYPEVEYKNNGNVDYYWFEMPEYDVEIYADFGEGDYVAWIDRSDMENGTIRVSPNVADEDDTVSIYVTPDTGYQLDELIVEDEDGHDVTTTSLASGTRYTFRMPDSDVTVTATFKSRNYTSNFTDVPRYEWYYEAVSYVASEGLMNGVSTTQFNPNGTASRAQIVTILWRLAGEPSALTGAFTDVPAGQYYSTAVAWASRQGIVTGVGNNRFEPNSNITREQLAVILYRYAQDAGYTTSASANITGYYDYARVNSYARTAMSWAVGAGLITGTSTTTLSPQDTATRAQVATILMRFCENIAK